MEQGRRLAREAVERALSLNPNLAEVYAQMGRLEITVDYDWAGANASYQRAVELEPGNPVGVRLAALSAAELGRFDEALQLAVEPLTWIRSMQRVGTTLERSSFTWGT